MLEFPNDPPFIFTSNLDVIRQVFTGKPEDLLSAPLIRVAEPLVGKNSLLLLDGERHIRERRMMTPAFHGERMLAYGHSMRRAATRAIDQWPLGEPLTLHMRSSPLGPREPVGRGGPAHREDRGA